MRILKKPDRVKLEWRFPKEPYQYRTFYLDDWDDDNEPPRPGFHRK